MIDNIGEGFDLDPQIGLCYFILHFLLLCKTSDLINLQISALRLLWHQKLQEREEEFLHSRRKMYVDRRWVLTNVVCLRKNTL